MEFQKKANWDLFREKSDQKLLSVANSDYASIDELCDQVNKSILDAATESIPKGCRKRYKPFWSDELQAAVDRRKAARKDLTQDHSDQNKVRYNRECAKVRLAINQAKRSTRAKTTGELNLAQDGTKAWSLLNNFSGDNRRENPKPMTINNTTIDRIRKKQKSLTNTLQL